MRPLFACESATATQTKVMTMTLFLLPGDLICDAMSLPKNSDHRQVLRSFLNTMIWGAVAMGLALTLFV
jgi:hypothetical protein